MFFFQFIIRAILMYDNDKEHELHHAKKVFIGSLQKEI